MMEHGLKLAIAFVCLATDTASGTCNKLYAMCT